MDHPVPDKPLIMKEVFKRCKPGKMALMAMLDLIFIFLSGAVLITLYEKIALRIARISELTDQAIFNLDIESQGSLSALEGVREQTSSMAVEVLLLVILLLASLYILYSFFMGLNVAIARNNYKVWWIYAIQRAVLFVVAAFGSALFIRLSWFNKTALMSFFDQLALDVLYILFLLFLFYIAYAWTARLKHIKKKNVWREHLKIPFREIKNLGKHYLISLVIFVILTAIFFMLFRVSFWISLFYLIFILVPSISVIRIHAASL